MSTTRPSTDARLQLVPVGARSRVWLALLTFGLPQSRFGFFFKQTREHEQGIRSHPCQGRSFVGSAPHVGVEFRAGQAEELVPQEPICKLLQSGLLIAAERSGRCRPHFEPCFGSP